MLRQLTKPLCNPVSLEQARKHLAVDASDRSNDKLIEMLIESGTADSQMKTGRIWVESDWEWVPEDISVGAFTEFPIVPVVGVKLYDMTPKEEEPEQEEPPVEGGEDEGDGGDAPDIATRRLIARQRAKRVREGETLPDTEQPTPEPPDEPEEPQWPEVGADYLNIEYPSLDPMGYPAIGGITPKAALPASCQLVLTVGYPVEQRLEKVEQYDNPILALEKTGFADGLIRLVFNRPVDGVISIANFEVRKKYIEPETPDTPETPETPPETSRRHSFSVLDNEIEGPAETPVQPEPDDTGRDVIIPLEDAYFIDGAIEIQYTQGALAEGDAVQLSFFEGDAHDEFDNFVQPIVLQELPEVKFISDADFQTPEPVPEAEVYESLAPAPIKNWILTRVGSLYSQRTEIALRAGKSNDAMFPNQFINNLLDPYRVQFFTHHK